MFAQPSEALGGSIGGGAFNGPAVSEVGVPFAPAKPLRISNAGGNTLGMVPLRRPFSYNNTFKEQYNQSESLNGQCFTQRQSSSYRNADSQCANV